MSTDDSDRIAKALARGRKAADRLAPATDELTKTLGEIERALIESRLGVTARVKLPLMQDEHEEGFYPSLTFRKDGKGWRLLLEQEIDQEVWREIAPLLNASRELRMRALDALPSLIEALVKAAEMQLAEVEQRNEKAQSILAALRKHTPPGGAS